MNFPAVDKKYELHRLISTLLSNQLKPNEKFEITKKNMEFHLQRFKKGCECYV